MAKKLKNEVPQATTGEGSGEGGVATVAPPIPAEKPPVTPKAEPVLKKVLRDPKVGKVLVYSVYPTYNLQLDKGEFEPRQDTKGRFYEHVVRKPSTIQFAKHKAWVSEEEAEKMREMVDFAYGQEFICADDLKALLRSENPEEKKDGRNFIKTMHDRGTGVLRNPANYEDIIDELAELK